MCDKVKPMTGVKIVDPKKLEKTVEAECRPAVHTNIGTEKDPIWGYKHFKDETPACKDAIDALNELAKKTKAQPPKRLDVKK